MKAGEYLFKEGDAGNYFYILHEGRLKLEIESTKETIYFNSGNVFGELALIQKNKRTGSVLCLEDASLFCIEGAVFREVILKVNKNDWYCCWLRWF